MAALNTSPSGSISFGAKLASACYKAWEQAKRRNDTSHSNHQPENLLPFRGIDVPEGMICPSETV